MIRPRDFQRTRVYRAGWSIDKGDEFPTLEDCQAYVDKIVASAWWRKRGFSKKVFVEDGRSRRTASGSSTGNVGTIKLPKKLRYRRIILHELGHAAKTDWPPEPWHGRSFARRFLDLVIRFMGREAGSELKKGYRQFNVKHVRKPTLTPDQRREAAERMQEINARKNISDSA